VKRANRFGAAHPLPRPVRVLAVALLALALIAPVAAQGTTSPRIVAIGDIHGDFNRFRGILEQAGIVDGTGRWIAGNTVLVQTGDFTDRGTQVRAVMDLLIDLEAQAARAGGRAIVLLGNHETMNLVGDERYVAAGAYAAFADAQSEQRRRAEYEAYVKLCAEAARRFPPPGPEIYRPASEADWMAAHPPGLVEYREAFGPQGRYGRWLRARQVVVQLGMTVFLHAGINPGLAPRRLDDVNRQVRDEIARMDDHRRRLIERRLIVPSFTLSEVVAAALADLEGGRTPQQFAGGGRIDFGTPDPFDVPDPTGPESLLRIGAWALFHGDGPLWFRGFATWSPAEGQSEITKLLRRYDVEHFVIGHTIPPDWRITPRFSGAVVMIDTGMLESFYPRGTASALEIQDGRFIAIYPDRRTLLFEAPRAAPARR
jgi:hypothetical protein